MKQATPNQPWERDGRKDFDFLIGSWKIWHRRLKERLKGCTEWEEFEGTSEVRQILDVELNALRARLRIPLVLCYLEALTRDEAAARLGWSLRTLERRL